VVQNPTTFCLFQSSFLPTLMLQNQQLKQQKNDFILLFILKVLKSFIYIFYLLFHKLSNFFDFMFASFLIKFFSQ